MNKNILEIYKKRRYNELLIAKRADMDKVEKDAYVKLADDYNDKLLAQLKADGKEDTFEIYKVYSIPTTKETLDKISEINKTFDDAMDDRNRLVEEIQAQIDVCETYEQRQDVYKTYGIIDADGKLYDYR